MQRLRALQKFMPVARERQAPRDRREQVAAALQSPVDPRVGGLAIEPRRCVQAARDCEALASFDRKLAAAAKKVKAGKVKVP